MTISDVYKEYVEKGKTEDEAAGICQGILTSGMSDATDEETYANLKQEFIANQKENNEYNN